MSKRLLIAVLALLALAGWLAGRPASPAHAQPPMPEPKVVFDLRVALEWEPGALDSLSNDLAYSGCAETAAADERYLADLREALYGMAAYVYRYSEGQMALGKITVTTGGVGWENADIRILANGGYRPTAFVGGIVDAPTSYISSTTGRYVTFQPGQIFLSRLWNGAGSRCGAWSQPTGWRTMGHEWGHYALFLWDEYLNQGTYAEQYCTSTEDRSAGRDIVRLPASSPAISTTFSLMGYHYRADKLTPAGTTRAACLNTPQARVHGVSDWETVKRFYENVPSATDVSSVVRFEGSPGYDRLEINMPGETATRSSAKVRVGELDGPTLEAQTYLLKPGESGWPRRILGQGELTTGDQATFLGVTDGEDYAAVLAQNWKSGVRYFGTAPLGTVADNTIALDSGDWRPSLSIAPVVFQSEAGAVSHGLRVTLKDCKATGQTPAIQLVYCPAGGDCGAPVWVPDMINATYIHTFTFSLASPPAPHGYIYARNSLGEETLTWYQRAGGLGPAHIDQHAPLLDAQVGVDLAEESSVPGGAETHVSFSPAQRCSPNVDDNTMQPMPFAMPAKVKRIVGTPFEVQTVIGTPTGGRGWGSLAGDPPLTVRISYSQDLLDRLGVDENQLILLRLSTTKWEEVPLAGRSNALDWLATEAQPFSGGGEVYALAYRVPSSWLPLTLYTP